MFLALLQERLSLSGETQQMLYSETEKRFLPDRYVEGECYICHYPDARGDQCDNCGNVLDAELLINPRSKIDGSRPVLRETEHYFLDLRQTRARRFKITLSHGKEFWRPNVLAFTRNIVAELRGRPITRDLDWGIPVPVEGWEGKCLYVWFEAVIGYLSASIEWAQEQSVSPKPGKQWWYRSGSAHLLLHRQRQHSVPHRDLAGAIAGRGQALRRPGRRSVEPALRCARQRIHEHGRQEDFRLAQLGRVGASDYLERYDPDPLRYYLTVEMPETQRHRLELGRLSGAATTTNWWRRGATWSIALCRSRTSTSTAQCRSPARWTRSIRRCSIAGRAGV